ncbi:hypothetical protein [Fusibacter sp. 3D3]|uniref:hypothetical protein n=1 Tax=Fusibacter sp. 3D3 TaxID=1048380 RepID=UPI0015864655|nr:hypothetical protein [Fusibacter sp. 3D3]
MKAGVVKAKKHKRSDSCLRKKNSRYYSSYITIGVFKMKKKTKIAIIIISCIVLIVIAGDLANGNFVTRNNQNLRNALKSIKSDSIQLNEVVPFEWDVVYTFGPYASKASIEEIVGFQSTDIKENNINEGMVHLLFVKEEKVVASILGYSESLGYRLDFPSKVIFSENAQFDVTVSDGIVVLTYRK